ncbi:MAG: hypothetical protein ACYTAN_12545 [Planctomycetota bacterium]
MARFRVQVAGADSNDPAEYDALAKHSAAAGFKLMVCGAHAAPTDEQVYDKNDPWLKWPRLNSGMIKVVETELINGIFSRSYIDENAALLAEKSRILARYGLEGVVNFLEPQIFPEWFYEKHPHLRGARVDNPCLALTPYYSPCLDQPEILAHYREGVRNPGPNGPDYCKDIAMGDRMRRWFNAIGRGARDAGKELDIFFLPFAYSRDQVYDTIDKLPRRVSLLFGAGLVLNDPFVAGQTLDYITRLKKRRRRALFNMDLFLTYPMMPLIETPMLYFVLDALREAAASGADGIGMGCMLTFGGEGGQSPLAKAVAAGLKSPPASWGAIERIVSRIAREEVGSKLAPALIAAWRDVDTAIRFWPNYADTNHMLQPIYSFLSGRWITRPIVPDNKLLSPDEKAHYLDIRGKKETFDGSDPESFFIAEGTMNYKTDEFKWIVAIYDNMLNYMNRALATLDEALVGFDKEDAEVKKRFVHQRNVVAMLRAVFRTQRNVYRAGSIIEFFTGEKEEEYWNVVTKDETCLLPAAYKRLFLEAVDDEIRNCREMLRLIAESDVPLIHLGEKDEWFELPADKLPSQIEKKIGLMEKHKADIDALFPGVGDDMGMPPTYEWADKCKEKDREIRERDRSRMTG